MASCSGTSHKWMFLVNHVFLPPKLPQEDDTSSQLQENLAQQVLEALGTFKSAYEGDASRNEASAVDAAISAVSSLLRVHHFSDVEGGATINAEKLQEALTELKAKDSIHPILLHVSAQNAGILVYRHEDSLILEMFELSPQNQVVIGTIGRLRRKFPGIAISVPVAKLESSLISTIARALDRMSSQVVPETIPITSKAGRSHQEIRDTAHPKVVTELLAGFILPLGRAADVSSIGKHIRDEVLWNKCKIPWRRSSMWLLIRVSIHLMFLRSGLKPQDALNLYKHFMVHFAGHILRKVCPHLIDDSDCKEWCNLIYIMKAKISRRCLKLDRPLPEPIQHAVRDLMADDVLQRAWDTIQQYKAKESRVDLEPLQFLKFGKDTFTSLPTLDKFIDGLSKRQGDTLKLPFTPRCPLPEFDEITDWKNIGTSENVALMAAWCDSLLPSAMRPLKGSFHAPSLDVDGTCTALWKAMESYELTIRTRCSDNPEAWSLMVLGVLELWVACDAVALAACPILHDYDPDIDVRRLQSLILPFQSQMERLRLIEEYIEVRQRKGTNKGLWTSYGKRDTFAARYFDLSPELQSLRRHIKENATQEREEKVKEFNRLKEVYATLMYEYNTTQCSEASQRRNGMKHYYHPSWCHRCDKLKRAENLNITIHEWPLPTAEAELKTVVFELLAPRWFIAWRQATRFVSFDLLKCLYLTKNSPSPDSRFELKSDAHLKRYFRSHPPFNGGARIELVSAVKPHVKTHYERKEISGVNRVRDLLFENASRYRYFDYYEDCFVGQLSPTDGMDELTGSVTYQLPSRSIELQKFIHRPPTSCDGLPPNAVLASQSKCPGHLSLAEYKALCTVPLGHRIQWQNILLQVTEPSVDFKKVETCMVVFQCMYQAGPPVSTAGAREGHSIPSLMAAFGKRMLRSLRDATVRIEKNWRCVDELGCYIAIARRILSLTADDTLKRDALVYLKWARQIGLGWVCALKERVDGATDGEKSRFRSKVARAALVCVDSFNFQDTLSTGEDVLGLALQSPAEAADFIECCITIQECYHSSTDDGLGPILYWRWQQLCVRARNILQRAIVHESSNALTVAIQRSWVAFNPTEAGWAPSLAPGCQHDFAAWLTAKSVSLNGGENLAVQYCLVTGELRVNGYPLNRLPSEYEKHPMYSPLFGSTVLEVMPSDAPGMVFSGKKRYAGHDVSFGLSHDSEGNYDLLVRAVKDGRIWELVDPRLLQGFPQRFVSSYVHWYDLASKTVEFRPRKTPWTASDEDWRLGIGKDGKWQLTKREDRILVAPRNLNWESDTSTCMKTIFAPLVEDPNLELVYRPSLSLLEIELPRLKLAFYLEQGGSTIQSRQFQGMSIDPDQDIRTLVTLKNKLVLKSESKDIRRKVILVEGPFTYRSFPSHTEFSVRLERSAVFHTYDIDTRLGRLMDNGSLESKLRLCYLHALTSFCLPDPLTQKTGTEQALDILNSAAVKSFDVLSRDNISVLKNIAGLTPARAYYPEHLKVMQSVTWSPHLGFLAQHNGFSRAVVSLFKSAAGRAFLYREQYVKVPKLERTKPELLRRDEIRSATFRVAQYGADEHTTSQDREYSSRDMCQDSEKSRAAFSLADYILNEQKQLPQVMPEYPAIHIWRYLSEACEKKVLGSRFRLSLDGGEDRPGYDAHWLLDTHGEILSRNLVLYHDALSGRAQAIDKFDVAIWLATLAFSKNADITVIQFIASFVNERAMDSVNPPGAESFTPKLGYTFDKGAIVRDLENKSAYHPFDACPEYWESKGEGYEEEERSRKRYMDNRRKALNGLTDCVKDQWPCRQPILANHGRKAEWKTYVKDKEAIAAVYDLVTPWFDNYELQCYIARIVKLLPKSGRPSTDALCRVKGSAPKKHPDPSPRSGFISTMDVFCCPPPRLDPLVSPDLAPTVPSRPQSSSQSGLLDGLIHRLDSLAVLAFQKDYVASLRQSISALEAKENQTSPASPVAEDLIEDYLAECKDQAEDIFSAIKKALNNHMSSMFTVNLPSRGSDDTVEGCFSTHWPRITPSFLLQRIAKDRGKGLPAEWKECIAAYGVSLVQLQRAERMMASVRCDDTTALRKELLNTGHKNWDPLEYPDSLLLEVESGITIRDVQEEIAAYMRSPPDRKNAVMQLNMGEGKSSVIVPIVASALADGKRLMRVFVARPQSKQMLQMLTSKLGGLLDRVVFQMPFSRDVQVTGSQALFIHEMLQTCRDVGGVLLVQPEHVLSLQQMGTEYAISPEKEDVARTLNMTRHFLSQNARDIVDESDENFNVKFELVYTMGHQQPVDHSPQRWQIIQEILSLVSTIAPDVKQELPEGIEIQDTIFPGDFPRTRVLKDEAMQILLDKLVSRICHNGISGFPISRQAPAIRDAVRTYLIKKDLSEEEISRVEREGPGGFWSDTIRPTLALLRGLIACNVLGFVFTQKRWRVNYGLAPDRRPRTRLAVPYRAKDQPSARSEFSHPDVVIILTCLAYYYSGLTDDELFVAFDHLLRSDQANIEYERWVGRNGDIPPKFRTLAGVNTEDRDQCINDVFPSLKFSKAVIDYFLDHVVYPKEMKEFPSKLSASGWDLGEEKNHPTTGFSGTNDSRRLLPLEMKQLDLTEQAHTNALVMSYLLRPETGVTDIPPRSPTQNSDADALLDLVVGLDPPVRVILDVGAQVLELSNVEVAHQWLARITDNYIQAVVFFADNDELSVVDRNGHIERLQTSPFASQLDACLVFLDEAHTRGTDLKLPTNYQAAVTLGANQTKDGLMQGCMRMRKLGHGQNVVFCVPWEIKTKIRELLPDAERPKEIQVSDILIWSIRETWTMLQRGVQLWATQGRRHEKYQRLWNSFTNGDGVLSPSQAQEFLEDEAQTLLERYRPQAQGSSQENDVDPEVSDAISDRLRDFGALRCEAAALHEEQERELAPEIEIERELELPPPTAPASHSLHPDVKLFATEGTVIPGSAAYTRPFLSLARTRAGREFDVKKISPTIASNLLVSADFAQTVKLPDGVETFQDLYLRAVQWVLMTRKTARVELSLLIVSPYEANLLMAIMSGKCSATLHIYSPRVNRAFPSLDDMSLFPFPREHKEPIPRTLTVALNLFSGQLYFNDYEMYIATCRFLGLSWESANDDEILDSDGFILRDSDGRVGGESGFSKSPVKFFRDLMLMRRDSKAIGGTDVGDMLDNRPLSVGTFN